MEMLLILVGLLLVMFMMGYMIATPTGPSVTAGAFHDGLTHEQRLRLWIAQSLIEKNADYATERRVNYITGLVMNGVGDVV